MSHAMLMRISGALGCIPSDQSMARAALIAMIDPPDDVLMAIGKPYEGKLSLDVGLQHRRDAWNKMIYYILGQQ